MSLSFRNSNVNNNDINLYLMELWFFIYQFGGYIYDIYWNFFVLGIF